MSEGTQDQVVRGCREQVGATRLLGLEGLRVQLVELDGLGLRHVHLVTADVAAAACPECGVILTSVQDRPTTRPRDIPYGSVPIRLWWH